MSVTLLQIPRGESLILGGGAPTGGCSHPGTLDWQSHHYYICGLGYLSKVKLPVLENGVRMLIWQSKRHPPRLDPGAGQHLREGSTRGQGTHTHLTQNIACPGTDAASPASQAGSLPLHYSRSPVNCSLALHTLGMSHKNSDFVSLRQYTDLATLVSLSVSAR